MKRSGRILVLVFALIIALLLSTGVYFLLQGKVKANEEEKIEAAFQEVFPDAVSFNDAVYNDSYLKRYLADNGYAEDQVVVNNVSLARDETGSALGIVATVSAYKKYGGIIQMLVGVRNDGTVNRYSILRISDAKGLDLKVEESAFADQFAGKRADPFVLVSYEVKQPGEILTASGAEDASQTVILGVNAAVETVGFIDEVYGGLLN